MTLSDGITSHKTSLPANDQNQNNEVQDNPNKNTQDLEKDSGSSALKGNYRESSKKPGKKQPVKKTGDHGNEEKQLGNETEITDETTI